MMFTFGDGMCSSRKCRTHRCGAPPQQRPGSRRRWCKWWGPDPETRPASAVRQQPMTLGSPECNLPTQSVVEYYTVGLFHMKGLDLCVAAWCQTVCKLVLYEVKSGLVLGTDLHIPWNATEATAAVVAQLASAAPSVWRPRVCRVCSAAWTLASSTAAHSLAGVKGWLQEHTPTKIH